MVFSDRHLLVLVTLLLLFYATLAVFCFNAVIVVVVLWFQVRAHAGEQGAHQFPGAKAVRFAVEAPVRAAGRARGAPRGVCQQETGRPAEKVECLVAAAPAQYQYFFFGRRPIALLGCIPIALDCRPHAILILRVGDGCSHIALSPQCGGPWSQDRLQ